MSEKNEYVEVTLKVPKKLLDLLEAENYLGWKPEDFYEAAIRSAIGITLNNMAFKDLRAFYGKYGKNIDVVTFRSSMVVSC